MYTDTGKREHAMALYTLEDLFDIDLPIHTDIYRYMPIYADTGKREHAMALDTLKDLFDNDLLPDHKLKYFHHQPLHVLPSGEVCVYCIPIHTDIYRYLLPDNKR